MWFLAFLFLTIPARAQDIPACTPAREGVVACMSGKLCRCRFVPAGQRPAAHAWDCGIMRPACGEALNPPANLTPAQPLPFDPQLLLPAPPYPPRR